MSTEPPIPRTLGQALEDGYDVTQRRLFAPGHHGPLLAVCGLAGGAGTTTIAYLTALAAAQQSGEPVLVADTGGPSGAIAALAGVEAPRSLPELAAQLAWGAPPGNGLYAAGPSGVRVLASGPEFSSSGPRQQVQRVLTDAREAHGLTVIDCGTLSSDVDRLAATIASHLVWLLPATKAGVARAERVLAVAPNLAGKQLLVARQDLPQRQPKAPLHDLRQLASESGMPLILVPHISTLGRGGCRGALQEAQVAIGAILGAIRR